MVCVVSVHFMLCRHQLLDQRICPLRLAPLDVVTKSERIDLRLLVIYRGGYAHVQMAGNVYLRVVYDVRRKVKVNSSGQFCSLTCLPFLCGEH